MFVFSLFWLLSTSLRKLPCLDLYLSGKCHIPTYSKLPFLAREHGIFPTHSVDNSVSGCVPVLSNNRILENFKRICEVL